jgi:hypothetical protein
MKPTPHERACCIVADQTQTAIDVEASFWCALRWQDLQAEGGEDKQRFCGRCKESVHRCETWPQALSLMRQGRCIYLPQELVNAQTNSVPQQPASALQEPEWPVMGRFRPKTEDPKSMKRPLNLEKYPPHMRQYADGRKPEPVAKKQEPGNTKDAP